MAEPAGDTWLPARWRARSRMSLHLPHVELQAPEAGPPLRIACLGLSRSPYEKMPADVTGRPFSAWRFQHEGQLWRIALIRHTEGKVVRRVVGTTLHLVDGRSGQARIGFGSWLEPSLHTEQHDWRVDTVSSLGVLYKGIDLYRDGRLVLSSRYPQFLRRSRLDLELSSADSLSVPLLAFVATAQLVMRF